MISADGVAGAGYYSGGGGGDDRANYYTGAVGAVEPPGKWSGRFAATLGLEGVVTPAAMEAVFDRMQTPGGDPIGSAPRSFASIEDRVAAALERIENPLPEDVARVRSEIERTTRSASRGVDLTYAPAKSVTVAHAAGWRAAIESIGSDDPTRSAEYESIRAGIEAAVEAASQAAMAYLEDVATTRQGAGHGHAVQWVPVEGLAIASFLQHTSRANDPQLHVHNAVLNRAERSTDGAVRALDTVDLVAHKMAADAVASRVLAERLADLGLVMELRPDGAAREVVGVDQEVMDLFSQRSQAISRVAGPAIAAAEERLGRDLSVLERSRINEWANLATRDAKVKDVDVDTLLEGWQERLSLELGMGLVPLADRLLSVMDAGPVARGGEFSPAAVMAQALDAVSAGKASWTPGDLMLEVEKALPLIGLPTGQVRGVLETLTNAALSTPGVVQVAGNTGTLPPSSLIAGSFTRPTAARYAAPTTLAAERAIREATIVHQGVAVDTGAVETWLDENYPTIGPDQRAAVIGLASRDVALAQLVGPAGTGKSFTAGALAGAWEDLAGDGRVVGLAVSQAAANVLAGDGVPVTANLAAWKAAQGRLEEGRPNASDLALAIGPRDVVVIDESSMVDSADVAAVLDVVNSIQARAVLTGDNRQLSAIGAGGAMGLVEGRGDTYTLTDARRFGEEWERAASLGLREGSVEALHAYDIHGRLREADSMDAAVEAAARAAAAERLAGRMVSVTADTNADAARIANAVREHLVVAGVVEADGVPLARTGGIAGLGDEVMTRAIDRGLGVLNGSVFTVVGTGDDGSLSVLGGDGMVRELPADYVSAHVQHAYASTVHSAQGRTVDVGFTVTDGRSDAAAIYVGMTRGRDRNEAIVALRQDSDGRAPGVVDPDARPSAFAVLADTIGRDTAARAALVEMERDAAELSSMATILSRMEAATDQACRSRLDDDLDRLVEQGVLSEGERAALASDQSTEHLSRVVRAAEQAGHDPAVVLREAVEGKSLDGARSVAQVVAGRIAADLDVAALPAKDAAVPANLPAEWSAYLGHLQEQADQRAMELAARAVEDAPAWALKTLGPVPDEPVAQLEWSSRAGAIAAYREATGMEDEDRAIGAAPGLSQTETRAAWWDAWEALGRPSETRPEAVLSDGALLARAAAWEREQAWAPPHADASLKDAELHAEDARREAVLARAAGDEAAATTWESEADARTAAVEALRVVEEARAAWAMETAATRDAADRAAEELAARGLKPGDEGDRVTAEEWLAHQREVDAREEPHREVTDLDVPIVEAVTAAAEEPANEAEEEATEQTEAVEPANEEAEPEAVIGAESRADRQTESPEEPAAAGDEAEAEPVEATHEEPHQEETREEARDTAQAAPDDTAAHEEAPVDPSPVELDAMVATSTAAEDRIADRASEEAAHEAWAADEEALAPEAAEAAVAEYQDA